MSKLTPEVYSFSFYFETCDGVLGPSYHTPSPPLKRPIYNQNRPTKYAKAHSCTTFFTISKLERILEASSVHSC